MSPTLKLRPAPPPPNSSAPNLALNFSASADAASSPWTTAKVVEPLPDMSVAAAPLARRNSWNSASSGYFSRAGASSEL